MKTIDSTVATGQLTIELKDEFGNIKDTRVVKNLVVTAGKSFIAARLATTVPAMSHMALGTGTTAAAASNTALGTELARVALIASSATSNTASYTATFAPGTGTGAVTEAGIFNDATTGTMLCRTVFDVVNKAAQDTLSINWNITIT
jgi:uncharacterized membrane protein